MNTGAYLMVKLGIHLFGLFLWQEDNVLRREYEGELLRQLGQDGIFDILFCYKVVNCMAYDRPCLQINNYTIIG